MPKKLTKESPFFVFQSYFGRVTMMLYSKYTTDIENWSSSLGETLLGIGFHSFALKVSPRSPSFLGTFFRPRRQLTAVGRSLQVHIYTRTQRYSTPDVYPNAISLSEYGTKHTAKNSTNCEVGSW